MKIERLPYDVSALVDFYEEGFTHLGALCERTWHDRLLVIAEGDPAKLWNPEGALHEAELVFAPGDAAGGRDAAREIFPGCPLTFRLVEALHPQPLPLERVVLSDQSAAGPPNEAVTEKLWRAQFPNTSRWRLNTPLKATFHFSLVALLRCEIQAIDQHWSLRRLAIALPGGELDEPLAQHLSFAQAQPENVAILSWPTPDPAGWALFLQTALETDLQDQLRAIRTRQENFLRRELERIDDYFEKYEAELAQRAARSGSQNSRARTADRLTAARSEHSRRRADQVVRHEVRVFPHADALFLTAEPAWAATLQVDLAHETRNIEATFVPRARRWFVT